MQYTICNIYELKARKYKDKPILEIFECLSVVNLSDRGPQKCGQAREGGKTSVKYPFQLEMTRHWKISQEKWSHFTQKKLNVKNSHLLHGMVAWSVEYNDAYPAIGQQLTGVSSYFSQHGHTISNMKFLVNDVKVVNKDPLILKRRETFWIRKYQTIGHGLNQVR